MGSNANDLVQRIVSGQALSELSEGSSVPTGNPGENIEAVETGAIKPTSEATNKVLSAFARAREGANRSTFAAQPEEDVGFFRSYAAGVKQGLLEPLTLVMGKPESDLTLDDFSEQAGNMLGMFTGLGIGYIPFAYASGVVLRGVGLTAKLAPEVASFIKHTAAGTVQAAGTAESLDEVPERAAMGFAAGVVIDGLLLSRSMAQRNNFNGMPSDNPSVALASYKNKPRGNLDDDVPTMRAWRVDRNAQASEATDLVVMDGTNVPSTGGRWVKRVNLLDNPIARLNAPPPSEVVALENALYPALGDGAEKIRGLLPGLTDKTLSFQEVVADLSRVFNETIVIPATNEVDKLSAYVARQFPDAQVLSRRIFSDDPKWHEVLVHNVDDVGSKLTPQQINQWQKTGFFDGLEVEYRGKRYEATGGATAPGRIQIRDPKNRTTVFAPNAIDVSKPVLARVTKLAAERQARITAVLDEELSRTIGFRVAMPDGTARQGIVNTEGFVRTPSYGAYFEANKDQILGRGVSAENVPQAVLEHANMMGVKGIIFEEHGLVRSVRIIDPESVVPLVDGPALGQQLDNAVLGPDAAGRPILNEFTPSWRNNVEAVMRSQNVPPKEIAHYMDLYEEKLARQAENLLSPEFKNVLNAQRANYRGGCM